jgi:hypothetical protein
VAKVAQNQAFGRKMPPSDHTGETIKAQNLTGIAARFNDIKEAKYASQIREPLGKVYQRNYQWPKEYIENKENFVFGVPTVSSDSVKDIVQPEIPLSNPPEVEEMYKKTHGNFGPGEQKVRDYVWPVD